MVEQTMQIAFQHHQAGRLADAEKLYRQVLIRQPGHAEALHLLGVVAGQVGRADAGIELIRRAIAVNPAVANYHFNLGNLLRDEGLLSEATLAYRDALRLKPGLAEAHNNIGIILRDQGRLDEAIVAYRHALQLNPQLPNAYSNLGNALHDKGQLDQAIAACRQALRLQPDSPEVHFNLGTMLYDRDLLDEAIFAYREALRLKPDHAKAHNNLGNALRKKELFDQAVVAYRHALQAKPDYTEAHNNLGNALYDGGFLDEAIAAYHHALWLNPNFAKAHNNLGNALRDKRQFDEGLAACRDAIRLEPDFADAHNSYGNILKDTGQIEQAVGSYQRALDFSPNDPGIHSNLIFSLEFHFAYSQAAILQEATRWDERHGKPLCCSIKPHTNDRHPNRRLRIGYVSGDFMRHCQSLFTIPLFSSHDREQFEIYCYSSVIRPDDITRRIEPLAHVWRNAIGLSDARLADLVRADGIDILIDLTMHMARGRPLLFARKPAPIQVAWLAYPGTTGLSAIDYRLTDPYLDPPGQNDDDYSEKSIRLPDTFWCYDPLTSGIETNKLPASENKHVTFGCLNNFCKISERVLALWATVLLTVPDSQLLLLAPDGSSRQRTLDILASFNIDPKRIQFVSFAPRSQYLRTYQRIDIGLDTLPANGHTTSLDSYWMGVPVVTLVGQTVAARAGWSQLSNLGLQELAAKMPEQFVEIAANLAGDLPRLNNLRSTLRQRLQRSPLMDAPRFSRNIEAAYRRMWQTMVT